MSYGRTCWKILEGAKSGPAVSCSSQFLLGRHVEQQQNTILRDFPRSSRVNQIPRCRGPFGGSCGAHCLRRLYCYECANILPAGSRLQRASSLRPASFLPEHPRRTYPHHTLMIFPKRQGQNFVRRCGHLKMMRRRVGTLVVLINQRTIRARLTSRRRDFKFLASL